MDQRIGDMKIYFRDQRHGWVEDGNLFRTTWLTATRTGEGHNMILDLCFAASIGYATAGNYSGTFTLLRSEDCGANWKTIYLLGLGALVD